MTSTMVIGDLIGSRNATDRRALHRQFERAIAEVNDRFDPPTPMRVTVGDEYQGVFATLGDALSATLWVRLALRPLGDVRHGLGRGEIQVLGTQPRVEDGPGWWAARAAIEHVEQAEGRAATRTLRTAVVDPSPGSSVDLVNATLLLRDELVSRLGERSLSVLRGLLHAQTQRDLADELGISASAVSQRVRADGLGAILAAHELMKDLL